MSPVFYSHSISFSDKDVTGDLMELLNLWFESIKEMKLLEIYRLMFIHPQLVRARLSNHLAYPTSTIDEAQLYLGSNTCNMDSLQVAMFHLYSAKRHDCAEEEICLSKAVVDIILNASNEADLAKSTWGNGNTTLHLATFMNDEELADILIQKGCTPDATNKRGHSCFDVTTCPSILALFRQEAQSGNKTTKRYSSTHYSQEEEEVPGYFVIGEPHSTYCEEFPEIPSLNHLLTHREISPPRILTSNTIVPLLRQESTLRTDITSTLLSTSTQEHPRKVFAHLKKLTPSTEFSRTDKIFPSLYSSIKKKASMETISYEESVDTKNGISLNNFCQMWKKIKFPISKKAKHSMGSDMDIEIENFNVVCKPKTKWSWRYSMAKLKSLKA